MLVALALTLMNYSIQSLSDLVGVVHQPEEDGSLERHWFVVSLFHREKTDP